MNNNEIHQTMMKINRLIELKSKVKDSVSEELKQINCEIKELEITKKVLTKIDRY